MNISEVHHPTAYVLSNLLELDRDSYHTHIYNAASYLHITSRGYYRYQTQYLSGATLWKDEEMDTTIIIDGRGNTKDSEVKCAT